MADIMEDSPRILGLILMAIGKAMAHPGEDVYFNIPSQDNSPGMLRNIQLEADLLIRRMGLRGFNTMVCETGMDNNNRPQGVIKILYSERIAIAYDEFRASVRDYSNILFPINENPFRPDNINY